MHVAFGRVRRKSEFSGFCGFAGLWSESRILLSCQLSVVRKKVGFRSLSESGFSGFLGFAGLLFSESRIGRIGRIFTDFKKIMSYGLYGFKRCIDWT